jgi:hypothetical protein
LPIVYHGQSLAAASYPAILESPLFALVIALVGIGVTVILARRYRTRPRMVYQMHDYFVVGQPDVSSLGDIKILFNGNAVPRVVVTQLAVWNAGNTTVRRDDIVEADPLAVSIDPGSSILGTGLLNSTRTVNDFHISVTQQDHSRAFLDFDYLDTGDGALFQIIHTGTMNKAKLTGSLRGIPEGLENWGDLASWGDQKIKLSGFTPLAVVIAVMLAFDWIKSLVVAHHPAATKYFDWVVAALFLGIVLLAASAVTMVVVFVVRARSRIAPKALSRK